MIFCTVLLFYILSLILIHTYQYIILFQQIICFKMILKKYESKQLTNLKIYDSQFKWSQNFQLQSETQSKQPKQLNEPLILDISCRQYQLNETLVQDFNNIIQVMDSGSQKDDILTSEFSKFLAKNKIKFQQIALQTFEKEKLFLAPKYKEQIETKKVIENKAFSKKSSEKFQQPSNLILNETMNLNKTINYNYNQRFNELIKGMKVVQFDPKLERENKELKKRIIYLEELLKKNRISFF